MAGFDLSSLLIGGGGLVSGISSIVGGNTSKELGELQASLFSSNADILKLQAASLGSQADAAELGVNFAYAKGRQVEADVETAGAATEATQQHWYASNHLDPAYGSPLLHAALTASQVAHDVGIVRASSQIEAADADTRRVNIMGQQVSTLSQAFNASGNAAVSRVRGDAAQTAGYLGAGAAFLTAGGKMFRGGYTKDD